MSQFVTPQLQKCPIPSIRPFKKPFGTLLVIIINVRDCRNTHKQYKAYKKE